MIRIQSLDRCCGCEACVQRCPKECISFERDSEGFRYPKVDETVCIECGLCEKVCPELNISEPSRPIKVIAAYSQNETVRAKSSSGGVFSEIASQVIKNGGVVFGAAFNTDYSVGHSYATSEEDLAKFRGSKYVQSRIGETFREAEHFLKEGRQVLFSGTPCQIAGLKKYLRKEYYNLLTVDIVCHGVPSPLVWEKYLETFMLPQGADGKNSVSVPLKEMPLWGISFRDKRMGWKKFGFAFNLDVAHKGDKNSVSPSCKGQSNEDFYQPFYENPYMKVFLDNVDLRPSCYNCPAKSGRSGADITLGDFWGIEKIHADFDDDKGCSLILINTDKGKRIIEALQLNTEPRDYEEALRYNPAIELSSGCHVNRVLFMNDISKYPFSKSYKRLTSASLLSKIRRRLWRKFKS